MTAKGELLFRESEPMDSEIPDALNNALADISDKAAWVEWSYDLPARWRAMNKARINAEL